eukprot:scpid59797/ scgid20996/ Core-binding factor subunit beta; Polyomavirus enhancer-binding protein 2 beta subunit; SL3-3 enhancer factor 1 subunit beta; SL3/AKV core-binding factor beta subunit
MPKVHEDQKNKFEEDFFTKFHKDTEVKYVLRKETVDGPKEERIAHLKKELRDSTSHIAFKACGTNLPLRFPMAKNATAPSSEYADFDREPDKVHLRSPMILNGVCCSLLVVLDLNTFDGMGHLEFDEELATKQAETPNDVVDILPRRVPAFPTQPSQSMPPMAQPVWEGQKPLSDSTY